MSSTIGEHIRLRRARNQTVRQLDADDDPHLSHVVLPISEPSRFCKSATSSFFLLPTTSNETARKKPYGFNQTASFRGMSCTAASALEVSVPTDGRIRKHKKKVNKNKGSYDDGSIKYLSEARDFDGGCCVANPDVWCGPGITFSTDAVVGRSVNPSVVSAPPRRNLPSPRRKIDEDKNNYNQTEGSSVLQRRFSNQKSRSHAIWNSDSPFMISSNAEPTIFSRRVRGHLRRPYPDDLTEMMMLRNGFLMENITDSRDHFHDLRLDVDSMSYEQLLELGDRIGYVNTGLKESEIQHCLRKINPSVSHTLAHRKCSICQDEFEKEDIVGKLDCGHNFHVQCVKQWLSKKNACPVCKRAAYVKP